MSIWVTWENQSQFQYNAVVKVLDWEWDNEAHGMTFNQLFFQRIYSAIFSPICPLSILTTFILQYSHPCICNPANSDIKDTDMEKKKDQGGILGWMFKDCLEGIDSSSFCCRNHLNLINNNLWRGCFPGKLYKFLDRRFGYSWMY